MLKREDKIEIIKVDTPWQPEDKLIYLFHDSRPKLLKKLSGNQLSSSLTIEKIAKVEEIPISSSVDVPEQNLPVKT